MLGVDRLVCRIAGMVVYFAELAGGDDRATGGQDGESAPFGEADLKAAREKWIADEKRADLRRERAKTDFLRYKDAAGRFLDFHALRHTTAVDTIVALTPAGVMRKMRS